MGCSGALGAGELAQQAGDATHQSFSLLKGNKDICTVQKRVELERSPMERVKRILITNGNQ